MRFKSQIAASDRIGIFQNIRQAGTTGTCAAAFSVRVIAIARKKTNRAVRRLLSVAFFRRHHHDPQVAQFQTITKNLEILFAMVNTAANIDTAIGNALFGDYNFANTGLRTYTITILQNMMALRE